MLSSKLRNSSELFSSWPEDFSIIKQNKKQKLSSENLEHCEKKKLPAKGLTKYLASACNPLGNGSHLLANQSACLLEGML